MTIFNELSTMPRQEVEKIRDGLVLDTDEEILFNMAMRNKSAEEMSRQIHKSTRTVFRMLGRLRIKIHNYEDYSRTFEVYGYDEARR